MFEGKSFIEILHMGGWTLYVLLAVSVLSIMVIFAKLYEFWKKSKIIRSDFIKTILYNLRKGRIDEAIEFCDKTASPMAPVAKAGLTAYRDKEGSITEAMDREIMIETVKLERFVTILGTIGSVAVYIGLFGTVLGIIRAFHDISMVGSGGISIVIGGVSEALIATATGLFVAIPAVVAYNFFTKFIDKFIVNMEYCASAVEDFLLRKTPGKENEEN
ncbi:MAG: MotA/TolQ/ExbB proton channel family protein [Endomicrobium sp.]|jgi:biopolymer transport protein ExbB/TolQ|nr:MotA/TolQ/ExbB proton channel family protein [Endomicrobium sp.]